MKNYMLRKFYENYSITVVLPTSGCPTFPMGSLCVAMERGAGAGLGRLGVLGGQRGWGWRGLDWIIVFVAEGISVS